MKRCSKIRFGKVKSGEANGLKGSHTKARNLALRGRQRAELRPLPSNAGSRSREAQRKPDW